MLLVQPPFNRMVCHIVSAGTKHPAITGYTFVAADGVEMPLEEGTSAFITMNPGYIGRAELPESLKACTPCCAVMGWAGLGWSSSTAQPTLRQHAVRYALLFLSCRALSSATGFA